MPFKLEDHFTAFIDLLGFSEVSTGSDDRKRQSVLEFLLYVKSLRSTFALSKTEASVSFSPEISTFSDHIVFSYPLSRLAAESGADETTVAIVLLTHFTRFLAEVASAALSIGFLIRGGATIGPLYHSEGVVFGDALVESFHLESRTSSYPRVVLSPKALARKVWEGAFRTVLCKGVDGLYHFDYFKLLAIASARPGGDWQEGVRRWFPHAVEMIKRNLAELEASGKLNAFSKWMWFAHELRSGLQRLPPETLENLSAQTGINVDESP